MITPRLPSARAALRQASSSASTMTATPTTSIARSARQASSIAAATTASSSSPRLARPVATTHRRHALQQQQRGIATTRPARMATPVEDKIASEEDGFDISSVERAQDEADVIIVGGGPAGLSAAIRIKQLAEEKGEEIRVVVLEKGAEVGNHILSGAVIQTNALDELLPNWKELGAPLNQPATEDTMRFLTPSGSFPMPHPPQMNNKGNYIVSLSRVTAWLGEQAEAAGVEIYSGFPAASAIWNEDGTGIKGVVTGEVGLDKKHQPKDTFEPGMEFHAPLTLFAEGAHGSLSQEIIRRLKLREAVGADPQTYGLGVKEVWRVKPEKHQPGLVGHTLGWPLDFKTYGGSWLYHMEDNMVSLGLVVGLDYENPYLSPFREFQRMKHHPYFAELLEGGECIAYGARSLNEGGYQSIPKLNFPGGALIGCSAGFLNVPKIKGTHNAMKSGMVAAETYFTEWVKRKEAGEIKSVAEAAESEEGEESSSKPPASFDLEDYRKNLDDTYVIQELKEVRNLRPSFHNPLGLYGGLMYSGLDSLILKGRVPFTLHHAGEDHAATKPAKDCQPIDYPKPDGKLSFDILTSVSRTGTNHTDDSPSHLVVKQGDFKGHVERNVGEFGGLLGRACPAQVYEYQEAEEEGGKDEHALGKKLVINSQNCIHCKLCSIKVPDQSIKWCTPEGGGGPAYSIT